MLTGPPLAQARRIAVLRALHLGDLLCAVPALRALRAAAPQARITLIGLPWAADFARRYRHCVDDFAVFPGFAGFVEAEGDYRALKRFARWARAQHFDLAIQLHGSGAQSNRALRLLGASRIAGYHPDHPPPAGFLSWREDESEVGRWLRLLAWLGAPSRGEQLEWPLDPADHAECDALLRRRGLHRRPYACVHPGARLASRRWPPGRFAEVVESLSRRDLAVVLTGARAESALVRAVIDSVSSSGRGTVIDACGATSIGGLAALVARAELVVSNDTGLSHVAAAVATPSVVVSSGGDARRWAPLDAVRHRVLWHPVPCRPCSHAECPIDHPCARGVQVAQVLQAVDSQLAGRRHAA